VSAAFDRAVRFVLEREGRWSDDPDDPGGITAYGIIQPTLDEAIRLGIVPPETTLHSLTAAQAIDIYRALYWNRVSGDDLPEPIALLMFDMAVNQGQGFAIRTLQKILVVNADGIIGPKTLAAIQEADLQRTLVAICDWRLDAYLVSKGTTKFIRGWTRRLFRVLAEGMSLAAAKEIP
jgi:lysozyme family protein